MTTPDLPETNPVSPSRSPASSSQDTPPAPPPNRANRALPAWFPPLFFLSLAALLLWRALFTAEVFLPAGMLAHIAPWTASASPENLPPWNPLRWDGIAQFYPWRYFAAQTLRVGYLPLWNPYQFCGTPFVANSQSAVFYPPNWLFALLPTAKAFGFSAALHLTLAGWFTYLFLSRLRCAQIPALFGGVVYAFSAWQLAWLQLPTFLATSCWFPLLLLLIHRTVGSGQWTAGSLGAVLGLMLLAGHLQIAFYGLLAGALWAVALLLRTGQKHGLQTALRGLTHGLAGLALGFLFSAPQLLPSLELSRMSHRVSKPSAEGYQAYIEYALPPAGLVMLSLPDFFGNDYDLGNPYWGYYEKRLPEATVGVRHNPAETALYVGVVPLLLALFALARGVVPRHLDYRTLFFGLLAAMALLMAFGTPVNAVFYFGVPGFGQSGSPARVLVLWSLAVAVLSGLGLDRLFFPSPLSRRQLLTVLGVFALLFAIGLSLASGAAASPPQNLVRSVPLVGEVFSRISLGWLRLLLGLLGGTALLWFASRSTLPSLKKAKPSPYEGEGKGGVYSSPYEGEGREGCLPVFSRPGLGLLLVIIDLVGFGIRVNPTSAPDAVYPETPGIAWLRERLGHNRIFPVNQRWSLYAPPPAILPPNAAMVYGLRDLQGYDSLLTGQYKAFANQLARPTRQGILDASPPEVGNMVFAQNPNAPPATATGAAFVLTPSPGSAAFAPEAVPPGAPLYSADKEMAIYALPNALPRARLNRVQISRPASIPENSIKPEHRNNRLLEVSAPKIEWLEDEPTRVTLRVETPTEGILELADQFYPGWKAEIDGSPVAIARASIPNVFRAVPVPSGSHQVTFRYEPASFRVGLYLLCLACLALAATATQTLSQYGGFLRHKRE